MSRPRRLGAGWLLSLAAAAVLSGCGSGSNTTVSAPTIGAARVFSLANFSPAGPVRPGQATTVAFTVNTPEGKPLTRYRTGSGPHTGVHLIIVRDDLAYIIHQHPPIAPNGQLRQSVTFPAPGTYHVVVDAYPNLPGTQPNFQLFRTVQVTGPARPQPLPPFRPVQVVDGYRVEMLGHPALHSLQAQFVDMRVLDPAGQPTRFTPWFGALAHAIFFHKGSLDYFHTHVCGAGASGCTAAIGPTRITGTSTSPGHIRVGVLLPVAGTWRLFLQMKLGGRIVTAKYTLAVR